MNNSRAIARLEDQLRVIHKNTELVCPLPRIVGTAVNLCGSGDANAGRLPHFMKSRRKMDSHPLPRVNPRDSRFAEPMLSRNFTCNLEVLVARTSSV